MTGTRPDLSTNPFAIQAGMVPPESPNGQEFDGDSETFTAAVDLPPEFVKEDFDPYDKTVYPLGFPGDPELLQEIFDFSDTTRAIFHHARDRHPVPVSPMLVLVREMIRRGTRCPVNCRLWQGTPLSTFVVIAGRSGLGKSESAKEDASPWPRLAGSGWLENTLVPKFTPEEGKKQVDANGIASPAAPILTPHNFDESTSLGSGQVLADGLIEIVGKGADVFVHMKPHPVEWVDEDELANLLITAKGELSTLISVLNSAWAGMPIGNKTRMYGDRRTRGAYNLFLTGGLQPRLAHMLMGHDASGFLQRFVFVSPADTYRLIGQPDISKPLVPPSGAMPVLTPNSKFSIDPNLLVDIRQQTYWDSSFDHLKDPEREKLSHIVQAQIRLTCLGALLHDTLDIDRRLWNWTGRVMEHSRRAYAWMQVEAKSAETEVARSLGATDAWRKAGASDEAGVRTKAVALKLLHTIKSKMPLGATNRQLDQALNGKTGDRAWKRDAMALLLGDGGVILVDKYYRYQAPGK